MRGGDATSLRFVAYYKRLLLARWQAAMLPPHAGLEDSMHEREKMTRRALLKRGVALGSGLALVNLPRTGRPAPSNRITLGFIGAGGMATGHLNPLLALPEVQVVAVCDVHGGRRDVMVKRVHAKYGNTDCTGYNDFRDLLARPDVDAVLIATPDHWHALQVIAAAKAGKHIYS
ncbi:MAG: hypothetical protein FJ279_11965, partial [Planctomycetes bacterium]|nr:hypothetical protein [Planctomycetota bacterium]